MHFDIISLHCLLFILFYERMFGKIGEMKKLYDKYKTLQKALKNLVIRAKEGEFEQNGERQPRILIDINGEMKIQDLQINDDTLLDPKEKKELQKLLMVAITKAQNKAQEVVQEKTKEIL